MTDFDVLYLGLIGWTAVVFDAAGITGRAIITPNDTGQDAPRPTVDHLVLRWSAWDVPTAPTGEVFQRTAGTEIRQQRRGVLEVQGFGRPTRGWLEALAVYLDDPTADAALSAAGLALTPSGGIVDVGALLDTSPEPRFSRDFEASYQITTAPRPSDEVLQIVVDPIVCERIPGATDPLITSLTIIQT